jgi:DNA-binding IclR family transcriptional regulator
MVSKIVGVLEILRDGKWHALDEVRGKMNLTGSQVQQIVAFLEEYQFVTMDETGRMMKIEEAVRKFLAQEATS